MAAGSGNLDWETRYRKYEPQLDQAIQHAVQLDPDAAGKAAAATGEANIALVDMERRAFELVRQGKRAEAQRLLSSDQYEAQKAIYAEGMTNLNSHLLQASEAVRTQLRRRCLRTKGRNFTRPALPSPGGAARARAGRRAGRA